ncbi:MAG: type II toxin-antitoxin system Phd/YefM family antitoxin [Deltaproteobacteria bacterium]|nr:type II toxin-antitoxin system Phd/YefM family antitoxin [Deltaproteobacteria bacterium]
MTEMSISEARKALTTLTDQMSARSPAVAITRRGRPVLALINWDLYEAIVETLEVMADPELMDTLRAGLHEADHGKTVPSSKVAKDLGL